jgi:hypothetical protein
MKQEERKDRKSMISPVANTLLISILHAML